MKEILERLEILGQPHLSAGLDLVSPQEQEQFLEQLKQYDVAVWNKQREAFKRVAPLPVEPLTTYEQAGSLPAMDVRKMGCLVLAGGMGSRLGHSGPKGTAPVIDDKSLFQLLFEKALAASRPLAILTSPLNHAETKSYLENHNWFGLSPDLVFLFQQKMLPLLDDEGNWFLEAPARLAVGPDGNGGALRAFEMSGIWEKWRCLGVEYVNVVPIENPLADPFHAELQEGDVSLKSILRVDPEESVGVLFEKEGRIGVVEYFELPETDRHARNEDGSLRWKIANTGLLCFSMDFIQKIAGVTLPYHLARKNQKWKCETFIFDLLPHAEKCRVVLCPRETIYAPLKTADQLEGVRAALLRARIY
jgi:UDP-N-acetylglucosamine/UDP-N-acetylgalactosamine diphosphorylase